MRKTISALPFLVFLLIFSSCQSYEPDLDDFNEESSENLYTEYMEIGGSSILRLLGNSSRSEGDYAVGYPVLSPSDLKYLSTLSQIEMEDLNIEFKERLKVFGINDFDEYEYRNLIRIYDLEEDMRATIF